MSSPGPYLISPYYYHLTGSSKNQGENSQDRHPLSLVGGGSLGLGGGTNGHHADTRDVEDGVGAQAAEVQRFPQARDLHQGLRYQEIECLINDDYTIQVLSPT